MRPAHGPYRRPPQGSSAELTREALANLCRMANE
jgi:hypothetical protein